MKLSVRTKLFAVSVLVIAAVGLGTSLYLEAQLRDWLTVRIETRLLEHARIGKQLVERLPALDTTKTVDPIADAMGQSVSARVTIIADSGAVLGDSQVPEQQLPTLDDHSKRPEVVQAQKSPFGLARRYSATLKTDMLYTAIRYGRPDGSGVIRVAMPLSEVESAVMHLRKLLGAASIVGLLLALFVSGLGSYFVSRSLAQLVRHARSFAVGTGPPIASQQQGDELKTIARSMDAMSSEIERLLHSLARDKARFKTVLEGMNEAVLALDDDRNVTVVNHSARVMLDLPDRVVGRPLLEVFRNPIVLDLVSKHESPSAEHAEGYEVAELDLLGPPKRHLLAHLSRSSRHAGLILVFHDVTALRSLEQIRRDFVANVSHELRTPVSVVQATAENIRDGAYANPEMAKSFAETILRNSERLSRLITDLLDLARIESGNYPLDLTEIDIERMMQRVTTILQTAATKKQIELDVSPCSGVTVQADRGALEQVLVNLVDNAIKYSSPGGKVWLDHAQNDDGGIELHVNDDGPGISSEHHARLFERFYRVDPGRSREVGGTGLGLAIVKHLMHAMNGEVGVLPRKPQGSRFWIKLPNSNQ